jgi:hypothetical protein
MSTLFFFLSLFGLPSNADLDAAIDVICTALQHLARGPRRAAFLGALLTGGAVRSIAALLLAANKTGATSVTASLTSVAMQAALADEHVAAYLLAVPGLEPGSTDELRGAWDYIYVMFFFSFFFFFFPLTSFFFLPPTSLAPP